MKVLGAAKLLPNFAISFAWQEAGGLSPDTLRLLSDQHRQRLCMASAHHHDDCVVRLQHDAYESQYQLFSVV